MFQSVNRKFNHMLFFLMIDIMWFILKIFYLQESLC